MEDNPDVADVSVSMLEELGYRVLTVGDAASALEAIGKETFDLVVSDIITARSMDGLALARTIRGRQPALPVLLVTGYRHVANEAQADFLVIRKPFKLPELSRTTARMIAASKQPAITNVVRLRDVRDGGASRTKPR